MVQLVTLKKQIKVNESSPKSKLSLDNWNWWQWELNHGLNLDITLALKCLEKIFPKYELKNDPLCGRTTGGQDSCIWDCEVAETQSGQLIRNPLCLRDCFLEVNYILGFIKKDTGTLLIIYSY